MVNPHGDVPSRHDQVPAALRILEEEGARLEEEEREAEAVWRRLFSEQAGHTSACTRLSESLRRLEGQCSECVHALKQLEEEHQAATLEIAELVSQEEALRAALTSAQRAVEEAMGRHQALERSLSERQAQREALTQHQQQLVIAQAQREATLQSLTERLDAFSARAQEIAAERAALQEALEAKAQQQRDATARATELTGQLNEHREAITRFERERVHADEEVARISRVLTEHEGAREQALAAVFQCEQQLSSCAHQLQVLTQEGAERATRRAHCVERLRELYHIDEARLEAERKAGVAPLTDEERTTMVQQAQRLKDQLEGIGPVSSGTVEEYDLLKARLEGLLAQQQDLVKARDDLKASIAQINRTARTQFRGTFERIRQEFQQYYRLLFGGGEANLTLLDEDDVLESGIDIVARPPGKRLQSISLLSGGERALTAVALLFALFKVRPSPVCILDEIDAPLDEANVHRFTGALAEFLTLSQFILITHNKQTITKADSLYGVTMEEPGISRILSAKLTHPQPTPQPQPVPVLV